MAKRRRPASPELIHASRTAKCRRLWQTKESDLLGSVRRGKPPAYTKLDSDCWLWQGDRSPRGYGRINFSGLLFTAHSVFFFLRHQRLPKLGLELDHLCNQRGCVNPFHLEEVTRKVNVRRIYERRDAAKAEVAKRARQWQS